MEIFSSNPSRRDFLKTIAVVGASLIPDQLMATSEALVHSEFKPTNKRFRNGEHIYAVEVNGKITGEFWPVKGINLVTKDTDPEVFQGSIENINANLKGVATAPDGMTAGSVGNYKMEGKSLSSGRPCGDGSVPNYGIIVVENGFDITFTHKAEILDFETFYSNAKNKKDTLFFLPSVYRNGQTINSQLLIDKVLIRRETPNGVQIGPVIFDHPISGNKARENILGLDRKDKATGKIISRTTHIYVLDGGPKWGQSVKEVYDRNNATPQVEIKGTRDKDVVTNYLVFY